MAVFTLGKSWNNIMLKQDLRMSKKILRVTNFNGSTSTRFVWPENRFD